MYKLILNVIIHFLRKNEYYYNTPYCLGFIFAQKSGKKTQLFKVYIMSPKQISVIIIIALFIITSHSGCSSENDESTIENLLLLSLLSTASSSAIAPDSPHTGNDCGCGVKTTSGSGFSSSTTSHAKGLDSGEYVPDEVIVKFREEVSRARANNLLETLSAQDHKTLFTPEKKFNSQFSQIKLPKSQSVEDAIAMYNSDPDVEYAQPNYIYRITATPDDPDYGQLWGLHNTGQSVNGTTGTPDSDINAPEAWDTVTDCSNVIVAVLDSGINYDQRDLALNMWNGGSSYPNHGYDFSDNDNDPMDLNGHGTHVAGTIGAYGDDNTGLVGVCWNVQLMAVRVMDGAGNGFTSTIAQGINFAIDQGAHIINASLGGPNDTVIQEAVNKAESAGVILVASAGNSGVNIDGAGGSSSYPAKYNNSNIISVAAIDQDGVLASYSNYGTTGVDIAAPGVNIISTWPGQSVITREDFSSWTLETGWYYGLVTGVYSDDYIMLTNPAHYYTDTYENSLNSVAYSSFDLNAYGAVSATVQHFIDFDTEENFDGIYFTYSKLGKPRYNSIAKNAFDAYTGSSGGLVWSGEFDLTGYLASNLKLGFHFVSDETISTGNGVGVTALDITRLYLNTTSCRFLNGTSMAAPHVAGVASLAIARYISNNGSYSRQANYTDIISVIEDGVTDITLSGSVKWGGRVNAEETINQVDLL